jgi:hypothetical protein
MMMKQGVLLLVAAATAQAYYSGRVTEDGALSQKARKSKVEGEQCPHDGHFSCPLFFVYLSGS